MSGFDRGRQKIASFTVGELDKGGKHHLNYPYQVPLRLGEFQDVRVYIRDASNQPASFLKGVTTLTLLLKKRLFEIQ